ncbi:MAG: HAD-IIIA family hydrolase [Myxococcales bacterium]|nr:HAD-IIIA family hydrolase [Myxococcales bacterium]
MNPAAFIDRDGTLIELVHHLTDPENVRLLPRAAEAVAKLHAKGFACVLVTNQSVIGRGMLDLDGLERVHAELSRQLAEAGSQLDGIYFCPVVPKLKDPTVVEHPDRKPGPGMLLRAAEELRLDLSRSYVIGDTVSDLLAGRNAGCAASVLVRTGYGSEVQEPNDFGDHVVDDIWEAAELIAGFHATARG